MQYCISSLSLLVRSIALQYWSIALARGLEWQYRPIRENRCCLQGALSNRSQYLVQTTLCILPPLAHFVRIYCIIVDQRTGSALAAHCRIPAGIPASVTPGRALCPPSLACPRSPRSQAFRPKEWSNGSHQITPRPSMSTKLKRYARQAWP